jgi:hypothetical protein
VGYLASGQLGPAAAPFAPQRFAPAGVGP